MRPTWNITVATVQGVWKIITTRKGSADLGGPIRIAELSGKVAALGVASFVSFMAILSINLGLINLLPIPILDGGHVVMNLYEWVTRRPPPPRLVNALANVFAVLFITLFVILTFRDSVRHLLPTLRHWLGG